MNILKTVGGCLVFESNLNKRDFYKEIRNFNSTFLFEIVKAWSHINFNSNPKIIKKTRLFGTIRLLKTTIKLYFTNICSIKALNILNNYLISDTKHSIPFNI